MVTRFERAIAIAGALATLAACSDREPLLPVARNPASSAAPMRNRNNPACNIRWSWFFRGSCAEFDLRPKGTTVSLAPYRGLSFSERIPKNSANPKDNGFAVGVGTSDSDITGAYEGKPFPQYGSIDCTDFGLKSVPCKGKALVYTVMTNLGQDMATGSSQSIHLSYKGSYPGRTCELFNLVFENGGKLVWRSLEITAQPRHGVATFRSAPLGFALATHDALFNAIVCY